MERNNKVFVPNTKFVQSKFVWFIIDRMHATGGRNLQSGELFEFNYQFTYF